MLSRWGWCMSPIAVITLRACRAVLFAALGVHDKPRFGGLDLRDPFVGINFQVELLNDASQ